MSELFEQCRDQPTWAEKEIERLTTENMLLDAVRIAAQDIIGSWNRGEWPSQEPLVTALAAVSSSQTDEMGRIHDERCAIHDGDKCSCLLSTADSNQKP